MTCSAFAQKPATAKCPFQAPLTLSQAVAFITRLPEGRTLQLVNGCRLGFALDSKAIDTLLRAKTPQDVMDAINEKTAGQLTVEQAYAQVAELQQRISALGSSDAAAPYRARVIFLEQSFYADSRTLSYGSYDADKAQLILLLGDEKYRFDNVPPAIAKTIYENMKQVKATESYLDDDAHTRTLRLASPSITASGKPLSAAAKDDAAKTVQSLLDSAAASTQRGDYDGAITTYDRVLGLQPDSQPARKGRADAVAAKQLAQNRSAWERYIHEQGEWVDPKTNLMWTLKDNGEDINFADAQGYCSNLRTGNHEDWTLPTLEQMGSIYDPSVTLNTIPLTHGTAEILNGQYAKIPAGASWPYHVKGGIQLSALETWSSSPNNDGEKNKGVVGNASDGKPYLRPLKNKILLRAACVRTQSAQEIAAHESSMPPAEAASGGGGEATAPAPNGVWIDPATRLTWTLTDNGQDIDWTNAAAYCKGLRTASFSDWRVPSINELQTLYDPKVTALTPPTTKEMQSTDVNGRTQTTPSGTKWTYHIKGQIVLTTGNVWTNYKGKPSARDEAVIFSFDDGSLWQRLNDPAFQRTLCVRP